MSIQNENKIKAAAINDLVGTAIGALESGFVTRNHLTLAELHQIARNHIKDSYGIETPSIVDAWGQETADLCGLQENHDD